MANSPRITGFGPVDAQGNTLYATWSWKYDHIDHFEVRWEYNLGIAINDEGNAVWIVGNSGTTTEKTSTYSIPSDARAVRFKVKPVAQTHEVNKVQVAYWNADWSVEKTYWNTPEEERIQVPDVPTVSIDKYTITAKIGGKELNTNRVQFELWAPGYYLDTSYSRKTVMLLQDNAASCTFNIVPGYIYKVRCRSLNGDFAANSPIIEDWCSDWSDFSEEIKSAPAASGGITTCRAESETSVYLVWSAATGAKTYEIEYSSNKDYFDRTDQTTKQSGIENPYYLVVGLETGQEYFFRVRAVNDQGESAWSGVVSVVIGKSPAAPTTWSSTTTLISGEKLMLYWVHNSADSSSQTYAELEIIINGKKQTQTIKNDRSDDDKDKTSSYELDTLSLTEGATIQWRVRTAGVTNKYGDWSVQREIKVYAPPTLKLNISDVYNNDLTVLTSFPFHISGIAGPNTQVPTGYHVTIKAMSSYETIDNIGNQRIVSANQEVFSKFYDTKTSLDITLSANDIDLMNNISYQVEVVVSMNTGLTCTEIRTFQVHWYEDELSPNAQIAFDSKTMSVYINSYCELYEITVNRVKYSEGIGYEKTEEEVEIYAVLYTEDKMQTVTGEEVMKVRLTTGEIAYACYSTQKQLPSSYTLSVYRREFDGTFTEIETGLDNSKTTYATDPHPSLDVARYRIVAISKHTGAVGYSDLPGYPIGEKAVIIQWNEQWSWFDAGDTGELATPPWSGSMLRLPYNIDVSDKNSPDSTLVKYQGRTSPVSYYGTQITASSSWKVDIPKTDKETLYAIRRLSIWKGDVYVREPSGTGYWANISVSYNVNHDSLVIPVSFEITKVEGGV